MNSKTKEDALTLEILQAINDQNNVTQRNLAERLGVALGLANSYLKRCVRKGLIKIEQAPANRYLYYLTPKGFAEKSRLTAEYLKFSFDFYRRSSASVSHVFHQCRETGAVNILLCGISELGEIATLRAREHDLKVIGFLDNIVSCDTYLGLTVWHEPAELPEYDACVVTDLDAPEAKIHFLKSFVEHSKIHVPDILGIIQPNAESNEN